MSVDPTFFAGRYEGVQRFMLRLVYNPVESHNTVFGTRRSLVGLSATVLEQSAPLTLDSTGIEPVALPREGICVRSGAARPYFVVVMSWCRRSDCQTRAPGCATDNRPITSAPRTQRALEPGPPE